MFVVIFNTETKLIVSVTEKVDGMIFGYSENCAKATVENAPTGLYFDGEPDPPDPEPEPEPEVVNEEETETDTEEAETEEATENDEPIEDGEQ